jgi:hypothetical protein
MPRLADARPRSSYCGSPMCTTAMTVSGWSMRPEARTDRSPTYRKVIAFTRQHSDDDDDAFEDVFAS